MKVLFFMIVLSFTFLMAENSPVGIWKTIDDETGKEKSLVEIWQEDGILFGKIIKLYREENEEQDPVCDKCPGELKNQRIVGMTILWDCRKNKDEWIGGKILDPNNGKTYKCKIKNESDNELLVRGFIGVSLIGRTQKWIRY
ncbi:MAG: DUF2147 domain-containing protein [Candidatus Cloacimonetes bacterium]|nr:DUF2147 domain-containing protein [Candidatus Cloacimonadota bacterium]